MNFKNVVFFQCPIYQGSHIDKIDVGYILQSPLSYVLGMLLS